MQVLRKIIFGLVQVPGELLLVQNDGIVILLEVADSTECEGICLPLSPFVQSHDALFGFSPPGVIGLACGDEIIAASSYTCVALMREEDTLIQLVDSPAQ